MKLMNMMMILPDKIATYNVVYIHLLSYNIFEHIFAQTYGEREADL